MLFCEIQVLARRLYESKTHFCGFDLSKAQKSALDSVWAILTGITAADIENVTSVF